MPHLLFQENRLGPPFASIKELKMTFPAGGKQVQRSRSPKLVFILGGECVVEMKDGFEATLAKGDLLLVPTPCYHYYRPLRENEDARLHVLAMFLEPGWAARRPAREEKRLFLLLENLFAGGMHRPGVMDEAMLRWLNALRDETTASLPLAVYRMRLLVEMLLVEAARRIIAPPSAPVPAGRRSQAFIVGSVTDYLEKTLARKEHSLASIAWHFRLSSEHLARIFRRETGMSVMEYLREQRIEQACTLLLTRSETMAVIADRLGFTSGNHFGRAFKARTGMTPSDYRNRHAGMPIAERTGGDLAPEVPHPPASRRPGHAHSSPQRSTSTRAQRSGPVGPKLSRT